MGTSNNWEVACDGPVSPSMGSNAPSRLMLHFNGQKGQQTLPMQYRI
jgi:hypothetical protein